MTFNSSSSFTSQKELATLGIFACSLTAFPVASLPSDSLLSAAGITLSFQTCVDPDGNNRHPNQNVTRIHNRRGLPPGIPRCEENAPDILVRHFSGVRVTSRIADRVIGHAA